jgi:hypothetical protein
VKSEAVAARAIRTTAATVMVIVFFNFVASFDVDGPDGKEEAVGAHR